MGPVSLLINIDDPRLLLLADKDNVYVCREDLMQGEPLQIGGEEIVLTKAIQRGHKIARRKIEIGEKVFKYGAPIGSATDTIRPGEHVHVHNVKSDYTPTHYFETPEDAKT